MIQSIKINLAIATAALAISALILQGCSGIWVEGFDARGKRRCLQSGGQWSVAYDASGNVSGYVCALPREG